MENKELVKAIEGVIPVINNPTTKIIRIEGTMAPPSNNSPSLLIEKREW